MNRIYIALVIFLVLIGLVYASNHSLVRFRQSLLFSVGQVRAAFEEGSVAQTLQYTRQLEQDWLQWEKSLLHQFDHEHVDGLALSVAQLEDLLIQQDQSAFISQLNQLEKGIEHLWRSEAAIFDNLF